MFAEFTIDGVTYRAKVLRYSRNNSRVGWPAQWTPVALQNKTEVNGRGWQTMKLPTHQLKMFASGRAAVTERQVAWALDQKLGLVPGSDKSSQCLYVRKAVRNLFMPLADRSFTDYQNGHGAPLRWRRKARPKICSLVSSDAITANVFDYLWQTSPGILTESLSLPPDPVTFNFERQFPFVPNSKRCPNVDAAFGYSSASPVHWVGIEAKLTEPFPATRRKLFSNTYLQTNEWWSGLDALKSLASTFAGDGYLKVDSHLDRGQLIKHILGMAADSRKNGGGASRVKLIYLWYNVGTIESQIHQQELDDFKEVVDRTDARFESMTWQTLIQRVVEKCGNTHQPYVEYIKKRYL